jgi:DNA-binding CsgD family transcriptional regulator
MTCRAFARCNRAIADVVEIGTSARAQVEIERALIERVRREVGFEVGFFLRRDGIGPGQRGIAPQLAAGMLANAAGYGAELAPVFAAAERAGGVAVDREVLGRGFERTRVFREFMRPHNGHSTALVSLSLPARSTATLALGRCERTPFSVREQRVLAALVPALSLCELALSEAGRSRDFGLTRREAQVLDYLERGLTNREIAAACGTSRHTVVNQLRSVFAKLGASTRAEAVAISLGRLQ